MSELSDKEMVASSSFSSQLADPRALAGLATGFVFLLNNKKVAARDSIDTKLPIIK